MAQSTELHDPLMVFFVSIISHKEHLSLVILCNGLGNVNLSRVVLSRCKDEDRQMRLEFSREDFLSSFLVELNNKGIKYCQRQKQQLLP